VTESAECGKAYCEQGLMSRTTLGLYKNILRAAQSFPSIKRTKLIAEIRLGFRENRSLEGVKLNEALSVAQKGLSQLSQYSQLPRTKGTWSVNLDQDPLPRPKDDKPN
jgi:LYR motif-containing protein 4